MASPAVTLGTLAGQPLVRSSFQSDPLDNEATTRDTVKKMAEHIRWSAQDPLVQHAAEDARYRFGRSKRDRQSCAWAAWWWAKHAVKFQQDEETLWRVLRETDQQDFLISPPVLLRMAVPAGDCDDFTMLVCALLQCLDCPWEVVTVAADPREPARWSHVYAVAVMEDGTRLPLDASHGVYPGWEVPAEHILRYQAWDENGTPVARPRPQPRMHGYRGLGDAAGCNDYDWNPTLCAQADVQEGGSYTPPFGPYPSPSSSPSSGGGFNWGSTVSNLLNQWTQIGARVIAPTTTIVRGPNGQLMVSTPAGAAPSSIASSLLGPASGSSWLLIALAAVAVVVVMKAGSK